MSIGLLAALMLFACTPAALPDASAATTPPSEKGTQKPMITREKAIEIARAHIDGKATISPDSTLEVSETATTFVVEWQRHLDVPGPDFDARVTVDKATGTVTGFLVDG